MPGHEMRTWRYTRSHPRILCKSVAARRDLYSPHLGDILHAGLLALFLPRPGVSEPSLRSAGTASSPKAEIRPANCYGRLWKQVELCLGDQKKTWIRGPGLSSIYLSTYLSISICLYLYPTYMHIHIIYIYIYVYVHVYVYVCMYVLYTYLMYIYTSNKLYIVSVLFCSGCVLEPLGASLKLLRLLPPVNPEPGPLSLWPPPPRGCTP